MRKFPKLKYPSDPETDGILAGEVVVTEKLDGANFRFSWDEDGTLHVGTRNHTFPWDDENVPKAFGHAIEYVKERESDLWGHEDLTLFGEAMHLHSLTYQDVDYNQPAKGSPHFGEGYPSVVLFDAWKDGEWMHWDEFDDEDVRGDYGIEDVGDLVEVENGDGSTTDWEVALRVDICANCAVPIDARTYCHHWDP